uniref:Erect wing, isoform J n=1 Tax=Drosophila melanogaster TaxID=7227 RepID=M9NE19_DROME|nr:erect wing, isoform J [Drosophila melanogaster]AFH07159.1 erect wing, isoform J [Drosophila melanogaster]|eukprot:NP_001245443.1 erect wing, isoform J [Drosophila melanogaster]
MATTSYRLVVAPAGSQRSSTGNVVVTTTSSGSHSSNGANGGTGGTSAGSSTLGSGLNVTTITATSGGQLQSAGNTSQSNGTTYKIEMLEEDIQSLGSDDDDEDLISSDGSLYEGDLGSMPVNDDVAHQLAAAGPVGVAAAAAIASSKKRKRPHCFETNPSVRKRQQNRLLRKLRAIIYEFTGRVGKQAVVLVATPGKPNTSYKVFGAKPLEDVLRNLKNIVMDELDNALAQQAPPPPQDDPSLFELPGLVIDGIPTPVEKMTQAQLRAFIPLMLKYSTGRGKPGWGRESTRPPWWPKELPWANVRMDARSEDDKQKVGGISWTHALRKIVINCYKYHGREDLLPTFADDEDKVNALISQSGDEDEDMELSNPPTIHTVTTMTPPTGNSNYTTQTVLSQNADGTVSLIQVDPNNPIITLPDGTTAQVQGVATLHQGEGGATIQTVQSLTDVNGHENMTVDLTETQDGQIYITTEDGQGYPVSVSNVISVPVSMYQSVMANVQQIQTNSDGTVCLAPMQVDTSINRSTSTAASSSSSLGNGGVQCYSLISAGSSVLSRRSGGVIGHQVTPGERYYLATTTSSSLGLNNNNNCTLANNNNSVKMPIVLATPSIPQVANKRSTGKRSTGVSGGDDVMVQKRGRPNSSSRSKSQLNANENAHSSGTSSSIRCVDSASLTNVQLQLPAIKLEHLG